MSDVEHHKDFTQRLLGQVDDLEIGPKNVSLYGPIAVAAAQVHATLALVGVLEELRDVLQGRKPLECDQEGCQMAFLHLGPHEPQIQRAQGVEEWPERPKGNGEVAAIWPDGVIGAWPEGTTEPTRTPLDLQQEEQ